MKVIGYKLTLLVFFITLLSGFYMRLPLLDNLIRAFVVYLIFSLVYIGVTLFYSQVTLRSIQDARRKKEDERKDKKMQDATANIAK